MEQQVNQENYQPKYDFQPPQPSYNVYDTKPLSTAKVFWLQILQCVPVVNLVVLIILAFGGAKNLNTRNYARGVLISWIVLAVLGMVAGIIFYSIVMDIISQFMSGIAIPVDAVY